jgi:polyketide biosynthesis 3-hydroxy-3-methylglutaryl-CoA synthase-like enzyme PksG
VGLFSHGSGCSSEFYSGIIPATAKEHSLVLGMRDKIEDRVRLSMDEYDRISDINMQWFFGIENKAVNFTGFQNYYDEWFMGRNLLVLKQISGYHREYDWS